MNILITKKKTDLITPETVNFTELVKSSNTTASLNIQSKIVELLNTEFTKPQQKLYVANLWMYTNYHPTNDFPISLEDVYKEIGFANKGNAKRTLENNFVLNEDYKIIPYKTYVPEAACAYGEAGPSSTNTGGSGLNKERIVMNTDTLKSLCMIAKTPEGKDMRKYYVKLENINNKVVSFQMEEQKQLLIEQNENTVKLLEEKDKYILELKEQEDEYIYIGHNPIIKDINKVGINSKTNNTDIMNREEQHKSSNPNFEFLFTYKTPNAKLIEKLVILLLKPFKLVKPEWFSVNYERTKRVVDFAIMMYDNYQIHESSDNLIEFISRYRSNRLINTNKARVLVDRKIYEEYVGENIIHGPTYKVSTELILDDFYDWYKLKYPEKINYTHIKLETGNYSTELRRELTQTISTLTKLEYTTKLSLSDKKRGIHFSNCGGFVGIELKSMVKEVNFFDKSIYEKYVNDFIKVTNNPRHKIARKEITDDFLVWIKNNNYICKNKIMCRTAISSVFKDVLMKKIENITGLKIQDVCKLSFNGCFIGMTHKNFPFIGNETVKRTVLTNIELIEKMINNWCQNGQLNIAKIFKKCINQDNKISKSDVQLIMNSKFKVDITSNKRKTHWHLIFEKENDNFFIKKEALDYYIELLKDKN